MENPNIGLSVYTHPCFRTSNCWYHEMCLMHEIESCISQVSQHPDIPLCCWSPVISGCQQASPLSTYNLSHFDGMIDRRQQLICSESVNIFEPMILNIVWTHRPFFPLSLSICFMYCTHHITLCFVTWPQMTLHCGDVKACRNICKYRCMRICMRMCSPMMCLRTHTCIHPPIHGHMTCTH